MKSKPNQRKPGKVTLNLRQAGEYLGIKKKYADAKIKDLIASGDIKGIVIKAESPNKNRWLIDLHSLQEYLDRN